MAQKFPGVGPEKTKVLSLLPFPEIPEDSPLRTHCYLCGQPQDHLEEEHVIPKVVFRGYNPEKYVKLWSCKPCNKAKGLDDEFVVRHLQFTGNSSASLKGVKNALRGLEKNHGRDTARTMAENIKFIEVTTPSGIIVRPEAMAFSVDDRRFENFYTNIAKGLYVSASLELHDWTEYEATVDFDQKSQSDRLFHDPKLIELQRSCRYGRYWEDIGSYVTDFTEQTSFSCLYFYSSHIAAVFLDRKTPQT